MVETTEKTSHPLSTSLTDKNHHASVVRLRPVRPHALPRGPFPRMIPSHTAPPPPRGRTDGSLSRSALTKWHHTTATSIRRTLPNGSVRTPSWLTVIGEDDDETVVYVLVEESLVPPGLRSVFFLNGRSVLFEVPQLSMISCNLDVGEALIQKNWLLMVMGNICWISWS
jgi:hypothetical protein